MSFNVSVRPARGEDRWALWEWLEGCQARKAWRRDTLPEREAYRVWFDAALKESGRFLLIGSAATLRIGAVRLVRREAGAWQATVMLKSAHWGGDYGIKLLKAALVWLRQHETVERVVMAPSAVNGPVRRLLVECGIALEEC